MSAARRLVLTKNSCLIARSRAKSVKIIVIYLVIANFVYIYTNFYILKTSIS